MPPVLNYAERSSSPVREPYRPSYLMMFGCLLGATVCLGLSASGRLMGVRILMVILVPCWVAVAVLAFSCWPVAVADCVLALLPRRERAKSVFGGIVVMLGVTASLLLLISSAWIAFS